MELVSDLVSSYPDISRHLELAQVLDQCYLPTRYPNALPGSAPLEVFTQGQAKDAVEGAARVVEHTRGLL